MDNQSPNPNSNSGGNPNGSPNGNPNGNPYGNPNGNPYGNPNGNPYGNPNGNPYGNPYGNPNGNPYGNPYGNPNGNPYGNPNGNPYGGPYRNPYGAPYPMPGYPLSNTDLKRIARQALSGHYGTMIGITLLLYLFSLGLSYLFGFIGNQLFLMCSVTFETDSEILRYGISFVLSFISSLLSCLFTVGSAKAFIQLLYGQPVHVSMLFHGFRHHPDRVMVSNMPLILITLVCSIPMSIYSNMYLNYANEYLEAINNMGPYLTPDSMPVMSPVLMLMALLSMAASIGMLFASLPFAMVNYLLVEMEDTSSKDIIRTSFAMMKGHKMRYFGLTISFLGWIFLGIFTCGIGLIWVMPYMQATIASFYLDTKRVRQQRQQAGYQ